MPHTTHKPLSGIVRVCLPVALLVTLTSACQSVPPGMGEDLQALQGHWEGQGPGGAVAITIAGDSLDYTQPTPDPDDEEFWFGTTFVLWPDVEPKQLHATIRGNNSPGEPHLGTVVVTLFELDGGTLDLRVVDDYLEPPEGPVTADWERTTDRFVLERAAQ